ncbi:aminoglycoside adenylyltransferase domain-containing protein [Paenibacillus etheri]|uniref:aminoglycoside adenylyltransferase domain-containing protein n=1 Tax=Paenibacillus etheri TaxID=1306852 RepID=UPI0024730AB4|nr:aminoglycoside adenylyltransferase domain-containing protein [Paenibacillus etheri]
MVALFKEELKGSLLGIYLHGSLAMGCFNPLKSDVDFLVVVKEKLTPVNNSRIAKIALSLHDEMSGISNERGIEFTIILETHLKTFVYPTPFEFHYSDYHREKYRTDENYLCGGFEDKDLASQIVVAYERGITLYGKPLSELYEPINSQYYLDSILNDVEGCADEIIDNPPAYLTPMYLTLNFCRVLYYVKEGKISSKREGGEWGRTYLPQRFQPLVKHCLTAYTDETANGEKSNSNPDLQNLLAFVEYMTQEIKQNVSLRSRAG